MRNRVKVVAAALVVAAGGLLAAWKLAPDRRPASQQILDALVEIQKAVEEKNLRGAMRHVSESYHDPETQSKRELTRLALSGFREPGRFHVVLQAGRPQVQGSQATVEVRVEFSVVQGPSVRRREPFTVHTRWVKEGRHWRVVWAEGYWQASEAFDPGM
jgi:hypothetical protein